MSRVLYRYFCCWQKHIINAQHNGIMVHSALSWSVIGLLLNSFSVYWTDVNIIRIIITITLGLFIKYICMMHYNFNSVCLWNCKSIFKKAICKPSQNIPNVMPVNEMVFWYGTHVKNCVIIIEIQLARSFLSSRRANS